MVKKENPMSMISLMCSLAAHTFMVSAQTKLGMDADKALLSRSVKLAGRSVEEAMRGDEVKANRFMGIKIILDTLRAKRLQFENPALARELMSEALRQAAQTYARPGLKNQLRDKLESYAEALGAASPPMISKPFLVEAVDSIQGPSASSAMFACFATFQAAAEIEITQRAVAGDVSWREWFSKSVIALNKPHKAALWRCWGAALEGPKEEMAESIERELVIARHDYGATLDISAVQKSARYTFKKSAMSGVDQAQSEAFIKALDLAVASLTKNAMAKASPNGVRDRLAERRESQSASKAEANGPAADFVKGLDAAVANITNRSKP